ncbi:MAG: hypothetical protein AAF090_06565 [Bacteroidota bacterium]
MRRFISSICIIVLVHIGYGCNNDDDFSPNCYQEDNRAVIERITRVTATILGPQNQDCSTDFVIEPNENINNNPLGLLSPCNLDNSFKVENLSVEVSGFIYESFATEDICADFFEITEIRIAQ